MRRKVVGLTYQHSWQHGIDGSDGLSMPDPLIRVTVRTALDLSEHMAADFSVLPGADVAVAMKQHSRGKRPQSGNGKVVQRNDGSVARPFYG